MTQQSWLAGIRDLFDQCQRYKEMWPVITFRILGEPKEPSNHVSMIIGHFQAVPEYMHESIRLTVSSPHVLEGTAQFDEFISLLEGWLVGEPGQLMGWTIEPPKIGQLDWEANIPSDSLWNPMLKEVAELPSRFICNRLSGRGNDPIYDIEREIVNAAHSLHMRRDEWMIDYLGVNVSPVSNSYLYVILPIAVGIATEYIEEDNQCEVTVTYRSPYTADDFWVRVDKGRWENSLPVFRFEKEEMFSDGWKHATYSYYLPESMNVGDVLNVWVGEGDTETTFRWSTRVELKSANDPEDVRRRFLSSWYRLGGQSVSQHIQKQGVGPKAGRVQDNFEVLLSNVCGALGYSVLFGGRALSTGGIDFVAFDSKRRRAYLFSVTVTNDVREKIRTLVLAIEDTRPALREWSVCPLVVCRVPSNCFLPEDIRNAQEMNIPILGEEKLETLMADSPDLDGFEEMISGLF